MRVLWSIIALLHDVGGPYRLNEIGQPELLAELVLVISTMVQKVANKSSVF